VTKNTSTPYVLEAARRLGKFSEYSALWRCLRI
jgi:hypothetical protein